MYPLYEGDRNMDMIRKLFAFTLALILVICSACVYAEAGEWICPDCGASNTMNYCIKCGAKKPEEIVCPECGTKYPIDSGAVFCGNCGARLQQAEANAFKYEGDGFATPEEALTHYMEGLKNLDFDQMLGAFAWETQMEHYSVQANLERLLSYSVYLHPRMPSANAFLFAINLNDLRYNQVALIYRSVEEYILGEDSPANSNTGLISFQKDSDDVSAFFSKFENGRLEKLTQMKNIRFLLPDAVTDNKFSMEQNQKSFIIQTACYGADEAVNLIGVADVGDETLYCCPTICRYGDKWYLVSVSSMTSMLIGVPNQYQAFFCGKGSLEDMLH